MFVGKTYKYIIKAITAENLTVWSDEAELTTVCNDNSAGIISS